MRSADRIVIWSRRGQSSSLGLPKPHCLITLGAQECSTKMMGVSAANPFHVMGVFLAKEARTADIQRDSKMCTEIQNWAARTVWSRALSRNSIETCYPSMVDSSRLCWSGSSLRRAESREISCMQRSPSGCAALMRRLSWEEAALSLSISVSMRSRSDR